MNSTPSGVGAAKAIAPSVLQQREVQRVASGNPAVADPLTPKRVGYGLPCAKCKTYYAADLTHCPICKGVERVSPTAASESAKVALPEELPDPAALEEERERFLREFKAQVYASHTQINAAASFRCSLEENHRDSFEEAAVCKSCYDHLQERVDVLEAALHMDLKEATQVVYNAVWADTSDSNKTYQNAAHALLSELRKRAGISAVMGPLKPRPH
ncbi:MAG TPA: hypothetical protein VMT28_14355 [Terriglobales bacterium]|jgi:hypothetical protein|nr:hypothetical protein [Terriglobales bacterium]